MSATKHEQIIKYIESLPVGTKVSVRQVAKDLDVSEGTAYRAIKTAENTGLVSSIPKVATIRIEKPEKKQLEDMTLDDVNMILEGTFLAGSQHGNRIPKSFAACFTMDELLKKGCASDCGRRYTAEQFAAGSGRNQYTGYDFFV